MPRKQKKYHYIYKTTCQVTGKFYVGMHSTDDLDDGYLGSGKILGYSRAKHGDENHKKEILELLPDRAALKVREAEVVNEELLADPLCINLKYGGEGGGLFWSELQRKNATVAGNRSPKRKDIAKKIVATKRERGIKAFGGKNDTYGMLGKQHSAESKQKMSQSNSGENNSSFGTKWMTDGLKPVKVPLEQVNVFLERGYRLGRK